MTDRIRSHGTGAITIGVLIFLYAPLMIVILFSFHSTGGLSFPFQGFSLRWYESVLGNAEFRRALTNSTIVAFSTSLATLVIGMLASLGIAKMHGRLRTVIGAFFFVPLTLPGLFIGLSLLVWFSRIELPPSLTTVTFAHVIYVFPYFILILLAVLDRLDLTLEETAADLGANAWQVFWKVTFPQVWPIMIAASCLTFALSFDEFIITFFVIGSESTLPMYIWSQLRRTVNPTINVISTLLLATTMLLWVVAFVAVLRSERRRRYSTSKGAFTP